VLKLFAVYAIAGVLAPVIGGVLGRGVAVLLGGGDTWSGPGYFIVSGPPHTGRASNSFLHAAFSLFNAATTVLVACAVAMALGVPLSWPVVFVAFLPVTFWRVLQLRSAGTEIESAFGGHALETVRREALRANVRRKIVQIASYVVGAVLTGLLVVPRF
jgi:hypothetical protein